MELRSFSNFFLITKMLNKSKYKLLKNEKSWSKCPEGAEHFDVYIFEDACKIKKTSGRKMCDHLKPRESCRQVCLP